MMVAAISRMARRAWDKGFEIHGHVFALLDITADGRRDLLRGWCADEWSRERYHVFRDAGCP